MKECKYCGNPFIPEIEGEKFCSLRCKYQWRLAFAEGLTPSEEREIRDWLIADRKPTTCEGCSFMGSHKCGMVMPIRQGSGAVSYMKYRDGRCKQK